MINVLFCVLDEAKRFEDGLQEQKDFLYIQRKYVSIRFYQGCIREEGMQQSTSKNLMGGGMVLEKYSNV